MRKMGKHEKEGRVQVINVEATWCEVVPSKSQFLWESSWSSSQKEENTIAIVLSTWNFECNQEEKKKIS